MDDIRKYINLIEDSQTLHEDQWLSHRDIAERILQHTNDIQLARDFVNLEDDFVSQDDMQSTGLKGMGFDPFQEDRDQVNHILSIKSIPFKVLQMRHNDQYETEYQILQSVKEV